MYISLAESLATGFRRWSDAHQPCGNDNEGEVARLDALAAADLGIEYAVMMPPEGSGGRLPIAVIAQIR